MAVKEDETTRRDYRKRAELGRILVKEEVQARIKLVTNVLRKDVAERTTSDQQLLDQSPEIVTSVKQRFEKRDAIKERTKEFEDPEEILQEKCARLAEAIKLAKCTVVYTGAGISTAASIPDYRGPNGVWTLLQKGQPLGSHDLSEAEPTLTHMALAELHKKQHIAHVVSQNCDGLHLRSGLPRRSLSEVHGNMFIEVCKRCKPPHEYIRLFDVTERTSLHRHKTGRNCTKCGYELVDTIIHFGERGTLKSPLNWTKAIAVAKKCDVILCIGSSLKVLRKYSCLWGTNRPLSSRPQLFIINLQWTPKDHVATLKINGRCDSIMSEVMRRLDLVIPEYDKERDPLFKLATSLGSLELDTTTKKELGIPEKVKSNLLNKRDLSVKSSVTDTLEVPASIAGQNRKDELMCSTLNSREPDKICDNPTDEQNSVGIMEGKVNDDAVNGEVSRTCDVTPKSEADDSEESKDNDGLMLCNSTPGWFGKGYRKNVKRRKRH